MKESWRLAIIALGLSICLLLLAEANSSQPFLWSEIIERYRFHRNTAHFLSETQDLFENSQACGLFLLNKKQNIFYQGLALESSETPLEITDQLKGRVPSGVEIQKLWFGDYLQKKNIRKIDGKSYIQFSTRLFFELKAIPHPWIEVKKASFPAHVVTNHEGEILDCAAQASY
ncbi:hypothetical protein ACLWBD_10515 [Bdellovibrio sp. HCB117]|uniref:hypothetical protein n=1 Tax=Bdellovibrio sp. HCB117 TaxID=3394359 RepID=UPI0039B3D730